jgi:hypothetical protein
LLVTPFEVTLLSADRKTTLALGVWVGPRDGQLRYTVCGQRGFVVRVSSRRAVAVSIRTTTS